MPYSKPNFTGKQILIVDDESDIRDVLRDEFEMLGATVHEADGGRPALEFLQKQSVDLVISDIRMPKGNGTELLDALRKRSTDAPPILLITGFADLTAEDAFDRGADGFFLKPFNIGILRVQADAILDPPQKRFSHSKMLGDETPKIHRSWDSLAQAREHGALSFGRHGFFLRMAESDLANLNRDAALRFELQLGADGKFEGDGIIRWVRKKELPNQPSGVGVELIRLSASSLSILEKTQVQPRLARIPKA